MGMFTRGVLVLAAGFAGLTGCASFSKDGGLDAVRADAGARLGRPIPAVSTAAERESAAAETATLLAQPLTVDDAVQLALLNNRGLQATYAELGIAEADVVQAGRLPNPRFGTTRTRAGDTFKYETSVTFPIVELLTLPLALRLERQRFEAVQLDVAQQVLRLGLETRKAWFRAVAAEQAVRYQEQVVEAAAAAAELATRMAERGNLNARDRMLEQAFHAATAARLSSLQAEAVAAREWLTRTMGLDTDNAGYALAERLPDLPSAPPAVSELEAFAVRERLDVRAAQRNADAVARSLGLTKATRFVDALEFGPASVMENGEATKKGYTIGIEVPLFDWGGARVARAEAQYRQAVSRIAAAAIDAQSEVRAAEATQRHAWEAARRHRDEIVPLQQQISEENLLRYNGMLIGVFELLAGAREQIAAVSGAIESLRDYWLAETALREAVGGRLPGNAASSTRDVTFNPRLAQRLHQE